MLYIVRLCSSNPSDLAQQHSLWGRMESCGLLAIGLLLAAQLSVARDVPDRDRPLLVSTLFAYLTQSRSQSLAERRKKMRRVALRQRLMAVSISILHTR